MIAKSRWRELIRHVSDHRRRGRAAEGPGSRILSETFPHGYASRTQKEFRCRSRQERGPTRASWHVQDGGRPADGV